MRGISRYIGIGIITIVVMCSVVGFAGSAFASVPGVNLLVSATPSGGYPSGGSGNSFLSDDGKFVAFRSSRDLTIDGGGNGLFLRNLDESSTIRLNLSTAGTFSNHSSDSVAGISRTGRYVLIHSRATNLIDGDFQATGTTNQVYLRDTIKSTTTRISQNIDGQIANGESFGVDVSSDGRFVLFGSKATNIHQEASDGSQYLYMLDRDSETVSILTRKSDGSVVNRTGYEAMSCDGALVVLTGYRMIAGEVSNHTGLDIYLLDRRGGEDKLTNITKNFNNISTSPTISCSGDLIGFTSKAINIDTGVGADGARFLPYVYDRINDRYYSVAVTAPGLSSDSNVCGTVSNGPSCSRISDAGIVAFWAQDVNMTGADGPQIYIRDIYGSTTQLISQNSNGVPASGGMSNGTGSYNISADGSMVTFSSDANNLLPGDNGIWSDVFASLTGF